jgi:hypothetical protein
MLKWVFIGAVAIGVFVLALVMPNRIFLRLTGAFKPKRIVETLESPVHIVAIREAGLITGEGKILTLPDVITIPKEPRIWKDILDYGVELNTNGSTYALVHVHHWCGNDPVRYHLARVDLSSLCIEINARSNVTITEFGIDPNLLGSAQLSHAELKEIYDSKVNTEPKMESRPE